MEINKNILVRWQSLVDCTALEKRQRCKSLVGSNPTLTAILCDHRIKAITLAFQANDVSSILTGRSILLTERNKNV